jgi:alanine racemase
MSRPTYAEVDLAAIRGNLHALRGRLAAGVRVLGVVKADAYGHGAVEVGRTLQAAGIDMLGVALVEEGIALRVEGVTVPVLVMGLAPEDEVRAAAEYGLTVSVGDSGAAAMLERCAAEAGRRLAVHLKIDTGMNRLGVRAEDAAALAAEVARLPHLDLAGAYTHLACADCGCDTATDGQLARFTAALDAMRAAGVRPHLVHAANSAAALVRADAHFDMIRSGLALYGVHPCPAARGAAALVPALTLVSHVAHVKRVRRGEGVSYGHRWTAARDSRIGVLPIGYADGYPRSLSAGGQARVAGRLVPVTGTICMDATMVDLTDVPEADVGARAVLVEPDNSSPISAAAVAALAGTIAYELLSGLGKRLPRVYRGA